MKREHRHELETNTLARYLSQWIDSGKPYAQVAALAALAVVAVVVLWSWLGTASTGRNRQAWQAYNVAVEGFEPNIDLLKQAAENYPDSPPGELAEVTWADGQVFSATNSYLISKQVSQGALDGAAEKYESIIRTSSDPNIASRAHLGLARVYELQADLENARSEYKKVTGPFEPIAKQSLERLDTGQAQSSIEWLAKAEMTRPAAPAGPGTPGVRPEFKPDELATPQADEMAPSFEDILKRIGETQQESTDRYAPPDDQPPPGVTDDPPPTDPQPTTPEEPPTAEPQDEQDEPDSTPPVEEPAAEEPNADEQAESPQS